jgi:hypothetical protein
MEQRSLRLGDLVDDYCPRERRVTNHAIVAIVNDAIRQTRCTACDTEHVFKGGKPPRRRAKDAGDGQPIDNTGGQLVTPSRADDESSIEIVPLEVVEVVEVETGGVEASAEVVEIAAAEQEGNGDRPEDIWPANRQLIRATLPRVEGEQPPPRPIPEFTMHQRYSGRGAGAFRQARSWAEQGFGSARGGNPNGTGNGSGNGARGDRRSGQGQNPAFPGQGQGRRRHGKKRPR